MNEKSFLKKNRYELQFLAISYYSISNAIKIVHFIFVDYKNKNICQKNSVGEYSLFFKQAKSFARLSSKTVYFVT